jgi:hypothetical protein
MRAPLMDDHTRFRRKAFTIGWLGTVGTIIAVGITAIPRPHVVLEYDPMLLTQGGLVIGAVWAGVWAALAYRATREQIVDAYQERIRDRALRIDRLREAVLRIWVALMRLPVDLPQYGQTIDDASIWTERELREMLEAARDVSARAHWIADKAASNLRSVAGACAMLHQGMTRNARLMLTESEYKLAFGLSQHHLQEIVETELEGRLTLDGERPALPSNRRALHSVESPTPLAHGSDQRSATGDNL